MTRDNYLINQEANMPYCELGIYYFDDLDLMIFGDTIMRSYTVSFDKPNS